MKKLIFVFVALFMLVLVSGCGTRQNTIRYNNGDEEGGEITEETAEEAEAETEESEGQVASSTSTHKLELTSFDGAFLDTSLSYNVVKGTTSSDTHKITINDYRLQKYIPGQTQWDYIASTRFNTLKDGLNTYVLKTFDVDGEQIDSMIFSINYDAPVTPEKLPGVGAGHWLTLLAGLMTTGFLVVFRRQRWI